MIEKDGILYTDDFKKASKGTENVSTNLEMLDSVRVIGREAFGNSWIETVKFPPNLQSIGKAAFINDNLKIINIENNVVLSDSAFEYNEFVEKINVNCKTIPKYCFAEAASESGVGADIKLVNTTCIEYKAFARANINSINFPKTLKTIGYQAFYEAAFENTTLELPEGLESIALDAFKNTNVTDVFLPDSCIDIGNLQDYTKINLHMSQKLFDKLSAEKKIYKSKHIIVDTIDNLIGNMSFKEYNRWQLRKEREEKDK